jgi:DNA-binding GntR family transcriptional regulator
MQKAVISGNVLAFIQADKALDEALAMAADNPFAARVAAPLQSHSRRFWFRYKADTGLAESAEHHVALIRSILDGDEEGAAKDAKKLMALLRGHAEVAATR